MRWANVLNALLGIWFIVAPYALGFTGRHVEMWTSVAGGIVLLVLSGYLAFRVLPKVATAE